MHGPRPFKWWTWNSWLFWKNGFVMEISRWFWHSAFSLLEIALFGLGLWHFVSCIGKFKPYYQSLLFPKRLNFSDNVLESLKKYIFSWFFAAKILYSILSQVFFLFISSLWFMVHLSGMFWTVSSLSFRIVFRIFHLWTIYWSHWITRPSIVCNTFPLEIT